jgi:hypothetical protein
MNENNARIEKLKKDSHFHNIPCFFPSLVETETETKVRETTDFLGNVIKDTIQAHLLASRKEEGIPVSEPMTSNDIRDLEDLFSGFHDALRMTNVAMMSSLYQIEDWVISYLSEELYRGTPTTIDNFIRELVKKLLGETGKIQDRYDNLITFQQGFVKKKAVAVDSRILPGIRALGIHDPDCDHIASSITNQSSERTIFVT